MEQKYVYILVVDSVYYGTIEQGSSVYATQESAKSKYNCLVRTFKKQLALDCFDDDGVFKEAEYEDQYVCDEYTESENGASFSFSFYYAGEYNNYHYTVYYRKIEVLE